MSNNKHTIDLPLSDNERLKSQSHLLRGTIVDDLSNGLTGGFTGDNFQLIRFHGMYQQDDRDLRAERVGQKLEPLINMMLRCRLPGGIITPAQWLGIDSFAKQNTLYGTLRLTNRQTFQFHGILKPKIKQIHQLLNQLGLDSIATAGDVNRNVLCTPNPVESILHQEAYEWAKKISEHLLPKTHAYAEIWLDKEKIAGSESEPILGNSYLPRKFKTAVVIPPHNDIDLHANDLIFIAVSQHGRLIGFNVLIGGGLSMTFGDKSTWPGLALPLGYICLHDTLAVAQAVVTTQRDWGNRNNRKNAKTRYTLNRIGLTPFRREVETRAKITFEKVKPYTFTARGDRFGWVKGIDNQWHLTLFIENGRLRDSSEHSLKSGMAEIAKIHQGDFRLTANQNIIIAGVSNEQKNLIEKLARQSGLLDDNVTTLRKNAMACVSFPTCPLAMAEAERFLPKFISQLDKIMAKYHLQKDYIVLRITGCPNGCGRAMLAEIGMVGRAIGRYNLYLGGNRIGTRIPRLFKENITDSEILLLLETMIRDWAMYRNKNEGFGDFIIRNGTIKPVIDPASDFYD